MTDQVKGRHLRAFFSFRLFFFSCVFWLRPLCFVCSAALSWCASRLPHLRFCCLLCDFQWFGKGGLFAPLFIFGIFLFCLCGFGLVAASEVWIFFVSRLPLSFLLHVVLCVSSHTHTCNWARIAGTPSWMAHPTLRCLGKPSGRPEQPLALSSCLTDASEGSCHRAFGRIVALRASFSEVDRSGSD